MNTKVIVFAAIILVGMYNLLFYHTQLGIGTGLVFLLLNVYFFISQNKESKNIGFAIASSVLSTTFAFLFSFRANELTQVSDLVTATFFALVALFLYKQPEKFLPTIPSFLLLPLISLKDTFGSTVEYINTGNWPEKSEKTDVSSSIKRGVFIALPVLAVLFFLLTQADPVFAKVTQDFLGNLGERTIVSLIIFVVLIVFGLAKIITKFREHGEPKPIALGKSHELAVITGSIVALFAFFIAIQFRYLFIGVGETELHQLGITSLTYSEYVRKGFFELLIAATIASSVIIYVLRFLHLLKDGQKKLIQVFSGILTIETALLLLSAAKRVALYADAHGLTRARVFGFIFLLWLALLLIIFLVRIIKEQKRERFFASVVTTTLLALFAINMFNIDGLIATTYKPTVNKEVDYFYLSNLSTDAYQSWKPAVADAQRILTSIELSPSLDTEENRKLQWTRLTLAQLHTRGELLVDKYGTVDEILAWHKNDSVDGIGVYRNWQSLNISEYTAYREIIKDMSYVQQLYRLKDKVSQIEQRVSSQVQQNTPVDRSTKPPLTR